MESIISALVGAVGLVFTVWVYCTQQKDRNTKYLAKQVMAYYAEEQEAMKWIVSLTGMNAKTVQTELRKRAEDNPTNEGGRPTMASTAAKKFL